MITGFHNMRQFICILAIFPLLPFGIWIVKDLHNLFFHTTLFHHIYISFVTTRQRSTYKQSIMDYNVRTLACIRTLETSFDSKTYNNVPKATGNGLIQCGTAITRSIFFNFSQQTTHSSPVRVRNGVPIVSFKSDLCPAAVSAVLCVKSW